VLLLYRRLQRQPFRFPISSPFHSLTGDICESDNALIAAWIVSFLPYWFRFLQSIRRYRDMSDVRQLANAGKYFTTILYTLFSLLHTTYKDNDGFLIGRVMFASFATLYSYVWDIYMDWGLLRDNEVNFLLRPRISFSRRFYWWSIFSNLGLRLIWIVSISPRFFFLSQESEPFWTAVVGALEILRFRFFLFFFCSETVVANGTLSDSKTNRSQTSANFVPSSKFLRLSHQINSNRWNTPRRNLKNPKTTLLRVHKTMFARRTQNHSPSQPPAVHQRLPNLNQGFCLPFTRSQNPNTIMQMNKKIPRALSLRVLLV
jgi:hypothetical protein